MKKIISWLAASFLLAACGNASTNDKTNTNNTQPNLLKQTTNKLDQGC